MACVHLPPSCQISTLPSISGRSAFISSSGNCAMSCFDRAVSVVVPCITWTNSARSGSPASSALTSSLSRKVGSPSKSRRVSSHHRACSGRSALRRAASADSNRATAMKRPSSVTPSVLPSQPVAPGASSFAHCSAAARTASASDVLPWMT